LQLETGKKKAFCSCNTDKLERLLPRAFPRADLLENAVFFAFEGTFPGAALVSWLSISSRSGEALLELREAWPPLLDWGKRDR
jgi:hypothetical protein